MQRVFCPITPVLARLAIQLVLYIVRWALPEVYTRSVIHFHSEYTKYEMQIDKMHMKQCFALKSKTYANFVFVLKLRSSANDICLHQQICICIYSKR